MPSQHLTLANPFKTRIIAEAQVKTDKIDVRIHRLLGAQHDLKLSQCSDLFGKKGMSFLEKLELAAPAGLLLKQQLDMLKNVQLRTKEDEKALESMMSTIEAQKHVLSIPGMGPILAAVVVNEIDDISRFNSAQKLCGYIGLCPSTSSSGGKASSASATKGKRRVTKQTFPSRSNCTLVGC